MGLSPYKSQVDVIKSIAKNKDSGLLLCLNTLTGEGKTSLCVAIAKLALHIRNTSNTNCELIYCCSEKLKTVRQQVGQYAYNGLIPFGIATRDDLTKNPIIVDNYNCKKLEIKRILTIADIESTIDLLKTNELNSNPINYLDSPATTSATTYKTQAKVDFTTNGGSVVCQYGSIVSTLIALEIGA
jgi:DNA helicase TIP49 (TBP-interacting protein)